MDDFPEQLELDLDLPTVIYDENTIYAEVTINLFYDRKISDQDWDFLFDLVMQTVDDNMPCDTMGGHIKRGTNKQLYPED